MQTNDTSTPPPDTVEPAMVDALDSPRGRSATPTNRDCFERDARRPHGPIRVILRLWGCTKDDITRAESNARHHYFAHAWTIVQVVPSSGTPCPIPSHDPIALNQNALYDAAWAAYPAWLDLEDRGRL